MTWMLVNLMRYNFNHANNFILLFPITFIIISLFYRCWFAFDVYLKQPFLFDYVTLLTFSILGLSKDLIICFALSILFYLLHQYIKKNSVWLFALEVMILIFITIIYTANRKLFYTLDLPLSYSLLQYAYHYNHLPNLYQSYMQVNDWLFIIFPVFLYSLFYKISFRNTWNITKYIVLPIVFILFLSANIVFLIFPYFPESNFRFMLLMDTPIINLTRGMVDYYYNPYAKRTDLPSQQQMDMLKLKDPLFSENRLSSALIKMRNEKNHIQNVLIIVMESAGKDYIFDTSRKNTIPMPFLKSLAHKGVWLNNNYTGGNTSSTGGFEILSGLYPYPSGINFEMQVNLKIKSIPRWFDSHYDSLYFNSFSNDYFSPKDFVANSFKKLLDIHSFNLNQKEIVNGIVFKEPAGINNFLISLDQVKSPFVAVYWTGPAHFPYYNYGHSFQILSDEKQPELSRYMNNLNLIDHQIKLIYEYMDRKKLLDNTLLIIVSDHGEGFGQHPNSWVHGSTLNEEQVKVPVLFYQPKIFRPQIINQVTSSADILPTILDVFKINYDSDKFQGQSLLRKNLRRKYVFIYGIENELAAVDYNNNKIILDYRNGLCKKFDLKKDPSEAVQLACNEKQEHALLAFRNFQQVILEKANKNELH